MKDIIENDSWVNFSFSIEPSQIKNIGSLGRLDDGNGKFRKVESEESWSDIHYSILNILVKIGKP